MIAHLSGTLLEKHVQRLVVDVGGVGSKSSCAAAPFYGLASQVAAWCCASIPARGTRCSSSFASVAGTGTFERRFPELDRAPVALHRCCRASAAPSCARDQVGGLAARSAPIQVSARAPAPRVKLKVTGCRTPYRARGGARACRRRDPRRPASARESAPRGGGKTADRCCASSVREPSDLLRATARAVTMNTDPHRQRPARTTTRPVRSGARPRTLKDYIGQEQAEPRRRRPHARRRGARSRAVSVARWDDARAAIARARRDRRPPPGPGETGRRRGDPEPQPGVLLSRSPPQESGHEEKRRWRTEFDHIGQGPGAVVKPSSRCSR